MPQNNQTLLEKTVADQWQTLPSGLTVLVRPMPGYSSTHVIYATKFGSIDRDFCLNGQTVHLPAGVAHFLEHKMFEDEDGDAFAKYAKTGANANAFTSFDRTCYLFTATQQLDESLDVLLGMVGHPYFTEQTIAKEQGIIGQEIKMYDDSPDWRLITGLFECLYHSHPIRSDIAGTVESIAEITPAMLYDSCKAFYAPGNMVLAAAGNTTMEQILAACARHGLMEPRSTERVQRLWTPEPMTLVTTETTLKMPVSKPCFGLGFKEEPLPEGDLRALGARSDSDADMLRVTMSEPTSLYLRGYVGQRYTSDGWREADAADMTANSEVLYQLHRDGYDSFSQLSTLAELLGQEAADVRMDIRVLGACRSTRLTPYGLDSGAAVISPEQLRDTVPNADGATGEKEYSFTAKSGLAAQAYALLGQLNDRWQEEALADYLTFEGYYRDFVYENYLTIPEETQKALTAYLGDAPEVITSYEAKRRIVNCLNDTLTYSETPESVDSEKDFVSALLADDPGGYDVHYATAAAVMLRYYGIPARYVEGYLITPQAVEGRTGETTLTLTGRDAHAWVEYYEDGVGWIPFDSWRR